MQWQPVCREVLLESDGLAGVSEKWNPDVVSTQHTQKSVAKSRHHNRRFLLHLRLFMPRDELAKIWRMVGEDGMERQLYFVGRKALKAGAIKLWKTCKRKYVEVSVPYRHGN